MYFFMSLTSFHDGDNEQAAHSHFSGSASLRINNPGSYPSWCGVAVSGIDTRRGHYRFVYDPASPAGHLDIRRRLPRLTRMRIADEAQAIAAGAGAARVA
jgi:hypothetical protein